MLLVFIEPLNFSFFGISGGGIDVDYYGVEQFTLERSWDTSVVFKVAPKYCILNSFVNYEGHSISSKGFLPIVACSF